MTPIPTIEKAELEQFSSWVYRQKAADLLGIHFTCIDRNAYAGHYPFRVKDGRMLYHAPSLKNAPIGNPQLIEKDRPTLNREDQKKVVAYRKELEQLYDDFVLQVVFEKGKFYFVGFCRKDGGYYPLPKKPVFDN